LFKGTLEIPTAKLQKNEWMGHRGVPIQKPKGSKKTQPPVVLGNGESEDRVQQNWEKRTAAPGAGSGKGKNRPTICSEMNRASWVRNRFLRIITPGDKRTT